MLLLGSCIHLSAQENMGYEAHMLPTEQHIRDTYVSEPKHALELLNEAEDKNSMPLYLIDDKEQSK